jgi:hypothetical protein
MTFPFEPNSQTFSLKNALGCALASQLAYSEPSAIETKAKGEWGFLEIKNYTSPPGSLDDTRLSLRSETIWF